MRTESTGATAASDRGAALVLGMLMLFIVSVLVFSLIGVTENELANSSRFDDHNKALAAAEAGVRHRSARSQPSR